MPRSNSPPPTGAGDPQPRRMGPCKIRPRQRVKKNQGDKRANRGGKRGIRGHTVHVDVLDIHPPVLGRTAAGTTQHTEGEGIIQQDAVPA